MTAPLISRRVIIQAALASGALGARGYAATNDDLAELLLSYRKLRFALHNRPLFWWLRATKYGLIDGVLTPLYEMHIGSFFQIKEQGSREFAATSLEMVYATALDSDQLLEQWTNPYTKQSVAVNNVPIGPNTVAYTASGPELPTRLPGARLEPSHSFGPLWVEDDDIWLRDDTSAVVTQLDGASSPFRVYDWPTYHGRRADVENQSLDSAPCTVSFYAVSNWQRWMGMGERPGNLVSRGFGKKVDRYDQLPARFRALLERQHPDIAEDPARALAKSQYRFER